VRLEERLGLVKRDACAVENWVGCRGWQEAWERLRDLRRHLRGVEAELRREAERLSGVRL
jgi:hypothetical protein